MQQAFIYRRVSTDSADSHTLEQQEAACHEVCEANGLTLGEVFREAGSTDTQQEPGTSPAEHREEK